MFLISNFSITINAANCNTNAIQFARLDGDTPNTKPVALNVVVLRDDSATVEVQTVSVVIIVRRSRPVITARAIDQTPAVVAAGRIEV